MVRHSSGEYHCSVEVYRCLQQRFIGHKLCEPRLLMPSNSSRRPGVQSMPGILQFNPLEYRTSHHEMPFMVGDISKTHRHNHQEFIWTSCNGASHWGHADTKRRK